MSTVITMNNPPQPALLNDLVTLQGTSEEAFLASVTCPADSVIPGLTVVVCTFKRPASVMRFLDSLWLQERVPDELIIVDASPDTETETGVLKRWQTRTVATKKTYCRVQGGLRGLTRQRNLALKLCSHEIVAFFDDDIVLDPGCLQAMEAPFHKDPAVVGVGAYLRKEDRNPGFRWQFLRVAGAVPNLTPGSYTRSGLSIPLRLLRVTRDLLYVDRLQGCCMAWRASLARSLGFNEQFDGYCQAEDLEFSLRAAKHGKLLICTKATALHLQEPGGRPDQRRLGRMEVLNRYLVHRIGLTDRNWRDAVRFAYAQTLFNAIHAVSLLGRGRVRDGLNYVAGLVEGLGDVCQSRGKRRSAATANSKSRGNPVSPVVTSIEH